MASTTRARAFCLAMVCVTTALAQPTPSPDAKKQLDYTRSHYTKYEFRIPMRDGVKLFTAVYVPKDGAVPYPIIMQRTPYSVAPYGIDNYRPVVGPSEAAEKEGFIFAYQDVRGRYLSEGTSSTSRRIRPRSVVRKILTKAPTLTTRSSG